MKHLGYFEDENEAARMYDKEAALHGKAVNFPLHEGMQQAVKSIHRKDVFKVPNVDRPSKYVGVNWNRQQKLWQVRVTMTTGARKFLGYFEDEKEAARAYDEQATLLGKPVNFPLHEGMQQVVKPKSKRKGVCQMPAVARSSKFVGVIWSRQNSTWQAKIKSNGKVRYLGSDESEKETARMYDEQAALLGRPVNFPLHEGQEQAVKRARKGSIVHGGGEDYYGGDGRVDSGDEPIVDRTDELASSSSSSSSSSCSSSSSSSIPLSLSLSLSSSVAAAASESGQSVVWLGAVRSVCL